MPPRRRRAPGPTRAVLYLRQSTYREESVSLEQQENACREHCARHSYTVMEVVADPGLSGRRWDRRPGVQRAIALLEDGTADVVVCWKWSRIARRRLDSALADYRAEQAGGRIESATEPADQATASGKLNKGILAEFAEFESNQIGENWRLTHARRRHAGEPAQGGRRYGYDRIYSDAGRVRGYLPNPAEAEVLTWMYEQVVAGRGAQWIAGELNRRGVPNPIGREWGRARVYPLLDSGFAAGLLIHEPRDDQNRRKGETYFHDGEHPAVIGRDLWERYRVVRRARATEAPASIEPKYRLTGLVVCGDCGASMWPMRAKRHGAGHVLVCSRWQRARSVRCVTAVRARVEEEVRAWLAEWSSSLASATRADEVVLAKLSKARRDERSATRKVTAVEEKLARLNRAWLDGTVPDVGYARTRDELLDELKQAQNEVEDAQTRSARRAVPSPTTATTIVEQWDRLPVAELRNLMRTMLDRVEVHPPAARGMKGTVRVVPAWDED